MSDIRRTFEQYYAIYNEIVGKIEHKRYQYVDAIGYLNIFVNGLNDGNVQESQKIYWQEILRRVHFASVISLIRSKKWLDGIIFGMETKNLLVFCSSLRGFLEATVDSYYSLEALPTSMALNFKKINLAVKGELNSLFFCGEIENKLIHFQFAKKGKRGKDAEVNIALSNVEYIKKFDLENKGTKELYSDLCEVTHPASDSVNCFTNEKVVSENYSYIVTGIDTDGTKILELINKYSTQIEELLKIGIGLYCICLKILTLFDYEEVHSDYIDKTIFSKLLSKDSWNEILEMIEKGEKYLDEHNMDKVRLY